MYAFDWKYVQIKSSRTEEKKMVQPNIQSGIQLRNMMHDGLPRARHFLKSTKHAKERDQPSTNKEETNAVYV